MDSKLEQQQTTGGQAAQDQGSAAKGAPSALQTQLKASNYAEGAALLSPQTSAPVQRKDAPGAKPAAGTEPAAGTKDAHGAAAAPLADGETVDSQVPPQVSLQNLSVSFTLPAGKTLAGSWTHEVRTSAPTQVTLSVGRDGVELSANPGIFIDAQWPAQNMRVLGAGRRFGQGQTWANVFTVSGMGEGFIDLTGRASTEITKLIDQGIAGTKMAEKGYDPFNDQQVMQTLGAIKANFESLPDAGGGGRAVGAAELTRPSLAATLKMKGAFNQESGGAGVRIPAGGEFTANIIGAGNLAALLAARTPGQAAQAVPISAIHLNSEAIDLTKGGDPIAKLQSIDIARGGQVTLGRFTLLGSGQTAAGFETLFRALVAVVGAAAQGAPPELGVAVAAQRGDLEPQFVQGISKKLIEDGLTAAVRKLVTENRNAIPGVDLAAALGIGG